MSNWGSSALPLMSPPERPAHLTLKGGPKQRMKNVIGHAFCWSMEPMLDFAWKSPFSNANWGFPKIGALVDPVDGNPQLAAQKTLDATHVTSSQEGLTGADPCSWFASCSPGGRTLRPLFVYRCFGGYSYCNMKIERIQRRLRIQGTKAWNADLFPTLWGSQLGEERFDSRHSLRILDGLLAQQKSQRIEIRTMGSPYARH